MIIAAGRAAEILEEEGGGGSECILFFQELYFFILRENGLNLNSHLIYRPIAFCSSLQHQFYTKFQRPRSPRSQEAYILVINPKRPSTDAGSSLDLLVRIISTYSPPFRVP